jgi:hypothetical protein
MRIFLDLTLEQRSSLITQKKQIGLIQDIFNRENTDVLNDLSYSMCTLSYELRSKLENKRK